MPSFALIALLAAPFALGAVHDIQVGKSGLAYDPPAISAQAGDTVVFHFNPKNHTVTQSSFPDPCGPLDGGFDSGFMPVAAGATDLPTFTYTVTNSSAAIWVYCKQAAKTPQSHCGQGMVFAINCGTNGAKNSFENFKNSALAIGAQLSAAAASATPAATGSDSAVTPAPTAPETVTDTITLESSTWTTTYASVPNSPNPTPVSLEGTVHVVQVGANGNLTYSPSQITAQPRDIISFVFTNKNHTATQSSFGSPCRKLASTSTTGQLGFDSDFQPVANGSAPVVWNVTVNDTAPIWVYCRQATPVDHCGKGMVFAVNSDETANSQKTFSLFQSAAVAQNGTASNGTTPSTTAAVSSPTSGVRRLTAGLGAGFVAVAVALLL